MTLSYMWNEWYYHAPSSHAPFVVNRKNSYIANIVNKNAAVPLNKRTTAPYYCRRPELNRYDIAITGF